MKKSHTNSPTSTILDGTTPVGAYPPNGYGLYDMVGNAWEWVADYFNAKYYARSPPRDPRGPEQGSSRVLRGGSWMLFSRYCRISYRFRNSPHFRASLIGFKCGSIAMTSAFSIEPDERCPHHPWIGVPCFAPTQITGHDIDDRRLFLYLLEQGRHAHVVKISKAANVALVDEDFARRYVGPFQYRAQLDSSVRRHANV